MNFLFVSCLLFVYGLTTVESSCLTVELSDSFGDGWGPVMWYLETPDGKMQYGAPTCEQNPVTKQVCGGHNGFYYLVVSSESEKSIPDNPWEVCCAYGINMLTTDFLPFYI